MTLYLLQRLLYLVPLLLGAVTIVFVLVHMAPGNPVDYIIGESGADKEMIARLTADMGLDRPLYIQLLRYLGQVATGNLGYSFVSNMPVLELILDRLPATLLLMASQLVFSISLGVGLGVLSARRPNSLLDNSITVFSLASFAVPVFWLGQLLILGFGYYLDWLPIQGMVDLRAGYTGFDLVLDVARHMVLPVLTLTLYNLALILRLTRGSMLEVVGQEYVKVARAKGLSENTVMIKHALRNALLPVVTVVGLEFRALIAGAVLTETVFAWPGLGRLTFDAIHARDYPLLMGMFIFISVLVAVGNLVTDLLYALLDPRIRYR
ncbi:MAG: ABC transporter permease [Alphaproteobacteria bacterium 65-37]|jgi:ABC-type dipeptide/oligopeptide/nickel transport system permease component|nr:ABC transporter permease [Alphaproteobacteria bacterium]OJU39828.1 MAG: ABC transporter permease [Alphaproteobacteria bacterium 65-37]